MMENNYNWDAFIEHQADVQKSYWAMAYEWLAEYEKNSEK